MFKIPFPINTLVKYVGGILAKELHENTINTSESHWSTHTIENYIANSNAVIFFNVKKIHMLTVCVYMCLSCVTWHGQVHKQLMLG